MLATQMPTNIPDNTPQGQPNPFELYARSLHDYTLRLWSESRRLAEERLRAQNIIPPTPSGANKHQNSNCH